MCLKLTEGDPILVLTEEDRKMIIGNLYSSGPDPPYSSIGRKPETRLSSDEPQTDRLPDLLRDKQTDRLRSVSLHDKFCPCRIGSRTVIILASSSTQSTFVIINFSSEIINYFQVKICFIFEFGLVLSSPVSFCLETLYRSP